MGWFNHQLDILFQWGDAKWSTTQFLHVFRRFHLESRWCQWCVDVKRGHIHADEVQENLEKSQIFVVDSVFSKILALGCYFMLFAC